MYVSPVFSRLWGLKRRTRGQEWKRNRDRNWQQQKKKTVRTRRNIMAGFLQLTGAVTRNEHCCWKICITNSGKNEYPKSVGHLWSLVGQKWKELSQQNQVVFHWNTHSHKRPEKQIKKYSMLQNGWFHRERGHCNNAVQRKLGFFWANNTDVT